MSPLRDAELALRLATHASRQQYVCRTCRAQAGRQFHTSNRRPFINRIRESLFGSKESKEVEKKRADKVQAKIDEQARRDATNAGLETRKGRGDRKYEVAAIVDTSINPEYIMSANWDGLRRIGSEKWIKERADPGVKYVGYVKGMIWESSSQVNQMQLYAREAAYTQRRGLEAAVASCYGRGAGFEGGRSKRQRYLLAT